MRGRRAPLARRLFRRAIVAGRRHRRRRVVWGLPELTSAASKEQDARVLNLVLALEYTEVAFYREALDAGGSRATSAATRRSSSRTRRPTSRSSSRRWGARPSRRRATTSGTRPRDADAFAAATMTLEDLVVATYNGQAVNVTPAALKAAARIVSVEGRHAAWIRSIVGRVPATEATDPALNRQQTRRGWPTSAGRRGEAGGLPPRRAGHGRRPARSGEDAGSAGDLPGRHPRRRGGGVRRDPQRRGGGQRGRRGAQLRAHARVSAGVVLHRGRASKALTGRPRTPPRGSARWSARTSPPSRTCWAARRIKRPAFNFRGTTEARRAFLKTAVAFEDLAVAAYKGQAPRLHSKPVLATAVSIHSVEARHAAWMRSCSASRGQRVRRRRVPRRRSITWWTGRISSWRARAPRCAGARVSLDDPQHTRPPRRWAS